MDGDPRKVACQIAIAKKVKTENKDRLLKVDDLPDNDEYEYKIVHDAFDFATDMVDQDYIHNVKKLINHLINPTRSLSIYGLPIHMNVLKLMAFCYGRLETGLCDYLLQRKDKQSFKTAIKLLTQTLHSFALEFATDYPIFKGFYYYLDFARRYNSIFIYPTKEMSIHNKVYNILYASHFIKLWDTTERCEKQKLPKNTMLHLKMSLYCALNIILYFRDYLPDQDLDLSLLGTQCCEDFFSAMGNAVHNKHTYSFYEMTKNCKHYIYRKYMRSMGNLDGKIIFPKVNKQREIDTKERYESDPSFCTQEYSNLWSTDEQIRVLWKQSKDATKKAFLEMSQILIYQNIDTEVLEISLPDDDSDDDTEVNHRAILKKKVTELNQDEEDEEEEEECKILDAEDMKEAFQFNRLFFVLPNGKHVQKRALSKFLVRSKLSTDRLQRVICTGVTRLTKDIINSIDYLTIGNYVRLKSQRFAQIFRILKKQEKKFIYEMDYVKQSPDHDGSVVMIVHHLKILDEQKGLFHFDEKGSKFLIEAKEVLNKLKGSCSHGIISLPTFNLGPGLPVSGKK